MKTKFFILIIGFLFVADVLAVNACYNPKTECIEPEDTRVFIDIPIRLSCWKYKTTYECKENNEDELFSGQEEIRPLTKTCEHVPNIRVEEEVFSSCQIKTLPNGKVVCFSGAFGIGTHKVIIPKNRFSQIVLDGFRHGYCYVTVINETTGQMLCSHCNMHNGTIFNLPLSEIQDQVFIFTIDRANVWAYNEPGYMTLYMDYKHKAPKIEWSETNCNEG